MAGKRRRVAATYGPETVTCLGETGIEQDHFSFLWTVNNYSVLSTWAEVKSPVFQGGPKLNLSWRLAMIPKVEVRNSVYMVLGLELSNFDWQEDDDRTIKAHFQLSVLNQNGRPVIKAFDGPKPHEFSKDYKIWGKRRFATPEQVLEFVVGDSIKILCEGWIEGELKEKVGEGGGAKWNPSNPSAEERKKMCKDALANDLGKIFRDSTGTDVTIETSRTSFKTHKTILMARSSVFAAMFSAKMKENEENTVKITDFDDQVVEGMLEHLYTGQTDCLRERVTELLQIADKYDLPALKRDCEFEIAGRLTKTRVAVILILAKTLNAPYLKQKAIDFINMNKEELLKTKSFVDTMKAHADTDVLAELYFSQQ